MKAASPRMERRLPNRSNSRSRSLSSHGVSRRRSPRPAAKVVTLIFTRDKAHAILSIDTEFLLGGEILKSAKSLANSLLGVDVSVDDFVKDFPHDCGGGWPDVQPDDAFVAYSQVTAGDFKGTVAMSRGSNQKIRMQGVAIGLVLSAVINHGIGVLPEHHQHIVGFNELVEQAQAAMTRTSSPAVGGSSRSSLNAQPSVETLTDRSHLDELRKFRSNMTLMQNSLKDMEKRLQELESH